MSSPVVKIASPLLAGVGCPVTIYGVGFSAATKVVVDGQTASPDDYGETYLIFSAPKNVGEYAVSLTNGDGYSESFRLSVVEVVKIPARSLPARSQDDYRSALLAMLPRGFAWYKGRDGNWWKLFSAFGKAFAASYSTFRELVSEMSPVKTTSFERWESEMGLPKKGLQFSTDSARLSEIYRIARRPGGCTVPYFKGIVALFGADCRIYEYWKDPDEFDGVDFGTDDPNFYWKVVFEFSSGEIFTKIFDCQSECDDFLREWSRDNIEALLDLMKPAHTKLVFTYTNSLKNRMLLATESGIQLVTENDGKILTEGT